MNAPSQPTICTSPASGVGVFPLYAVYTVLGALFREDKLANEASVGQTALKVMQTYREVVALYYRLPSSLPRPGRGEIDLLGYGQAACLRWKLVPVAPKTAARHIVNGSANITLPGVWAIGSR